MKTNLIFLFFTEYSASISAKSDERSNLSKKIIQRDLNGSRTEEDDEIEEDEDSIDVVGGPQRSSSLTSRQSNDAFAEKSSVSEKGQFIYKRKRIYAHLA